jgi:hypothetical protein
MAQKRNVINLNLFILHTKFKILTRQEYRHYSLLNYAANSSEQLAACERTVNNKLR